LKVLITGKNGQVGTELIKTVPKNVEAHSLTHLELDITSKETVSDRIHELKPDYIINAAAYTNVDKAESEPEQALKANAIGAGYLAQCAREVSARLIHISTDFVFDGQSSTPYMPDSPLNPISVYGKSKAEGEKLIRDAYAANSIILRTSWVYSITGRNFVKTMINMMKERDQIRVVADQVGSPTWAKNLALSIWAIVTNNQHAGIYHYSDTGVASWYDFAIAIYEESMNLNLLDKEIKIQPINTSQFPTPARRPPYSVLDCSKTYKIWGIQQEHWRTALGKMILEHKKIIEISDSLNN
jgi:dTDP-4-dehydrorhamnose reductase